MKRLSTLIVAALLALTFGANDAFAKHKQYQYAVKFVCGNAKDGNPVFFGRYRTAINIHNPWDKTVKFTKKAALTFPSSNGPQSAGDVSETQRPHDTLLEDEALEVDCPQIRRFFSPEAEDFITGFVVIMSRNELDVTAVYTQGLPRGFDDVATGIDVQQIPAREIKRKGRDDD